MVRLVLLILLTQLSSEALARGFKRLADRVQGVVSDTSMITISLDFSAHFLHVYVKQEEGATFTGDRISCFITSMQRLPFVALSHASEVYPSLK